MSVGPPKETGFYPFALLEERKQQAMRSGIRVVDFGTGDPREETPVFIRQALSDAITAVSSYPPAAGMPELREAIASWAQRRFGATIDTEQIIPTLGAKEIIHSLAAYVLDDQRDLVVVPVPSYPVYARGAQFHGGNVYELPLDPERGFLPDLSTVPADIWQRTAVLWLNYPHNPTGACAPLSLYRQAAQLAKEHGFLFASDEAYSELYFGEPPVSALQLDDLTNVAIVNTLSKRSCMTGYRSGFIAGDQNLIAALRKYRPSVGVTPQDFVQHASIAAWNDETHVAELRQRWAVKRDLWLPTLQACGFETSNDATFFLWAKIPNGESSQAFAERLLAWGLVVLPGSFLGESAEGYFRLALVPSYDDCAWAAEQLRQRWSTT